MTEAATEAKSPRKGPVILWLLALGVPLLLLLAWWPSGKPKSRTALPDPNGYDYFLKAGEAQAGIWTNLSHHTLSESDLQAFLAANKVCLDLAREGLRHRGQSHWGYGTNNLPRLFDELGRFRRIGRLLVAEGWLAQLEGKPVVASDCYLDAMRLGQECSRGGLLVERLVGIAIEAQALDALKPLAPHLDVTGTMKLIEHLNQLDASHDSPTVTFAVEDDWVGNSFPAWQRLMGTFHPSTRKSVRENRGQSEQRINNLQATRRRAIVEAAARLFELEKGRRPTGYADLVPAYLPAAPLDPTTGKAIAHPF